jgi:hypothetical protein
VLVIEGWIGDTSLQSVAGEIRSTNYEWIFTSGIPLENGSYLVEYRTHAEVAAHTLVKMGLPAGKVLAAPAPETRRDRTFSSAVAVADAVRAKGIAVRGINVISEGPHARRTRRAYERAFDGEMAIGIIATAPRDYDATHWWRYSEGIKTVISETAALVGDVLFPVTR